MREAKTSEALELLEGVPGDFEAEGLAARARLAAEIAADGAAEPSALSRGFSAWDAGDLEQALDFLQEAIAEADDPERRDLVRSVMVAIFTELGADHPLAREHRRRLAAALH